MMREVSGTIWQLAALAGLVAFLARPPAALAVGAPGYWTCSSGQWVAAGAPQYPKPLKECGSQLAIPEGEVACEAAGGTWKPAGLFPKPICTVPTRDAGRTCDDNDECEGYCLAALSRLQIDLVRQKRSIPVQGACTPHMPVFGCIAIVRQGWVRSIMCRD
jgi:hypothetical protein